MAWRSCFSATQSGKLACGCRLSDLYVKNSLRLDAIRKLRERLAMTQVVENYCRRSALLLRLLEGDLASGTSEGVQGRDQEVSALARAGSCRAGLCAGRSGRVALGIFCPTRCKTGIWRTVRAASSLVSMRVCGVRLYCMDNLKSAASRERAYGFDSRFGHQR